MIQQLLERAKGLCAEAFEKAANLLAEMLRPDHKPSLNGAIIDYVYLLRKEARFARASSGKMGEVHNA